MGFFGSAFFDVWRVLGISAYLGRQYESRTRVNRAIAVRSLARMGGWAQFSGAMEEDERGSKGDEMAKDKKDKKKGDGTGEEERRRG